MNAGELENAKRQRRQASLEQMAQAQEQALQVISQIGETRSQIRRAVPIVRSAWSSPASFRCSPVG